VLCPPSLVFLIAGLGFELLAILSVLVGVGRKRDATVAAKSATASAKLGGGGEVRASGKVTRRGPVTVEAIRQEIEELQAQLEEVKRRADTQIERARGELRELIATEGERLALAMIRRDDAIRAELRQLTVETIAERRREGILFACGVLATLIGTIWGAAC
jgi:hypothetical protein